MKQNAIVGLVVTTLVGVLLGCSRGSSEYSFTNVDAACRTDDVTFFAAHRTNLNNPLKRRMGYMTYAIILAAEHGKYTLVSNLLSFGAIATVTNFQGNTPLIAAMGAMTPPGSNVMTQLQSAGVDLNARNLQGETALMLACSYQPFNVVENLLSIGAEPNIADINGDRAINYASNTNKISALVKCNASLSFTNVKGETPLGLAMRAKPELVPYLREALSNSTVENDPNINQIKVGMTFAQVAEKIPLSEAQKSGSREHGGAWYTIPIDNNRILQLRFEHPKNNQSIRDTRLNLPPQIKPASGSH